MTTTIVIITAVTALLAAGAAKKAKAMQPKRVPVPVRRRDDQR
ncbi:hypothetical protein [Salinibius halmophilus]|nr:hypothetical protein [Salinibius halmophilus]